MFEHKFAEVNGVRLHYVTAGPAEPPGYRRAGWGELILFLHGFPEFWYAWKAQLAEFGRDYQAVALDMRGYNLSSKPAEVAQYQPTLPVEDIRALAERLGHKKFVLVGHDWGGAIAWAFAILHPEYLEKLIIINAPHPGVFQRELRENPAQQQASQYMLMFRTPAAEQILSANNFAALVEEVLGEGLKQGYFSEEDRKAYLEAWAQPGALTGGLNYYRAARVGPPGAQGEPLNDSAAALPSLTVRVPTLIIWGEKDKYLLTDNLNGLDQYVSDLTIRRIPHGSHWVIHEKPDLVNSLIRETLQRKP